MLHSSPCHSVSLVGDYQVMVLSFDSERGRVSLSTKKLEPTPGDMLRNPQLVFEKVRERQTGKGDMHGDMLRNPQLVFEKVREADGQQ